MQVALLFALASALAPTSLRQGAHSGSALQKILRVGKNSTVDKKNPECECQELPSTVKRDGVKVVSTSGDKYPSTYGAVCAAHDLSTPACHGKYKAAWCHQEWCYVDAECAAKDTKESFYFGKEDKVHYSYQNCGGLDAFAAEACSEPKEEKKCESFSDNCAWNKPSDACQNKLCQCTGSNLEMNHTKLGFEKGYGETCQEWDEKSCESYKTTGDGYDLGLWCCKSWCYVEESCPSAEKSAVGDGLFYSYYSCADDTEALTQCTWQDPIDFGGEPIPLSSDAAKALTKAHSKSGALVVGLALTLLCSA